MKIYFDGIIYSWQKGGGVHRYFTELINNLDGREDINVLMPEPNHGASLRKSINVISILGKSLRISSRYFSLIRKLMSPVNKFLFNNFFSGIRDGIFFSTYYTTYKSLKIPQVLIVHDLTHERFPEYFSGFGAKRFIKQKKKCIEQADIIICISEVTKKHLQDIYQVPPEKINVVLHAINDNFNLEYSDKVASDIKTKFNIKKPFLLFVGQRGFYKNFNFLLKSYAAWSHSEEYDLVVAGGSPANNYENELIRSLGLMEQIKFLGYVDEEELKILYCLTTAFIFPSLDEGFGLPNLEAVKCGANVLCSDLPVFRETSGDIPVYFNPREINSLVAALDTVVNQPRKSREDIVYNSEKVKDEFSWEKCIKNTSEVFQKALKSKTEK